jgi:FkbH-like protein
MSFMGINVTTLSEILQYRAAHDADKIIYTFLSQKLDIQAAWTCAELDRRAGVLAARILREARPGDRVLLPFTHSRDFIAAFYGCMYAGVIAVPLQPFRGDRDFARLQAVVKDTGARLAMTTADLMPGVAEDGSRSGKDTIKWLAADAAESALDNHPLTPCNTSPDAIAYLQYTSGSTADARGVMISHRNVISNLEAIDVDFRHCERSVGLTWLPHYHDMGLIYGLLQPLFNGYLNYVLAPASFVQRPTSWLQALSRFSVTHSGGPNFAYDLCVRRIPRSERSALNLSAWRVAFNGSEAVRLGTMDRFAEAFGPHGFSRGSFYPAYGLAEATLKVTGKKLEGSIADLGVEQGRRETFVSCGAPAPGTEVCIVDPETRQKVRYGKVGEIWLRGPGVAKGYWNRPIETQETFQARLCSEEAEDSPEGLFLRTGDLGFWDGEAGELIVSGRLKGVVVVRGCSHQAEDIEWTVQNVDSPVSGKLCAAFTVELYGEDRLVILQEAGFHLSDMDEQIARAIRRAVALEHGVQVYAVSFATHLPRTSSGKVKRHVCRELFQSGDGVRHASRLELQNVEDASLARGEAADCGVQQTEVEEFVAREVAAALRVSSLSRADLGLPLSSLGLDSLGTLEICHAIQRNYGIELPIWVALELSHAALSERIQDSIARGERRSTSSTTERRGVDEVESILTVSPEQERLWLMQEVSPGSSALNLVAAVRIYGCLDKGALDAAFFEMTQRHPYFLAGFRQVEGNLIAQIDPAVRATLKLLDLRSREDQADADARRYIRADVDQPFDLSAGPLIRALLICVKDEQFIAVFTIHHIVSDLWSLRIFLKELFNTYETLARGEALETSASFASPRYRDFAAASREALEGRVVQENIRYWEREFAGAPMVLPLRLDSPRPRGGIRRASEEVVSLDAIPYEQLRLLAQSEGTTPFVVLFAAYALLLQQISGSSDIVVATPFANRDRVEFQQLIGLCAHPMAIRIDLTNKTRFRHVLRHVRQAVLKAIEHHEVPFAKLVERAHPERAPGRLPLAQVFFGFNREVLQDQRIADLTLEPYVVEGSSTDFDLSMNVIDNDGQLTARLRYASDIFKPSTIERTLSLYADIIARSVRAPDVDLGQSAAASADSSSHYRETMFLSVAATFTPEPLNEFLSFWSRYFAWPLHIDFECGGPAFRSLLPTEVEIGKRFAGPRLFLLRVEDWARGTVSLQQAVRDFVGLLGAAVETTSVEHIVYVCPRSPLAVSNAEVSELVTEAEEMLAEEISAFPHTTLLWGEKIALQYQVAKQDDPVSDELAAIPYTTEFYAAIATSVFRKIVALRRKGIKVIVSDCDNTLWEGVVAENGVQGLKINAANQRLHDLLSTQKRNGVLLCLCSKNEEKDIVEVFQSRPDIALRWDDFAVKRINWLAKSQNLYSIAAELQVELESIIFVDDNPLECAEVRNNCPEISVLQVPSGLDAARILDHYWGFDTSVITLEGSSRTKLYREARQRSEHGQTFRHRRDYIASLQLKCTVSPLDVDHLPRVVELMHRTTQFNTTGLKKSVPELQSLLRSGRLEGLTCEASDKFGDYGMVGVILYTQHPPDLVVEAMLLSCRALGRGIEHAMTAECGRIASDDSLSHIVFPFAATARNGPALTYLKSLTAHVEKQRDDRARYRISAAAASTIQSDFDDSAHEVDMASSDIAEVPPSGVSPSKSHNMSALLERVAVSLRTAQSVVEAARDTKTASLQPSLTTGPRTTIESAVAEIWTELLGVNINSVDTDFFELGGDSLKAIRIVSQIKERFGVTLPLALFFEGDATIATLCSALEEQALSEVMNRK